MKTIHYDGTPCPEDCPCVFRKGERDAKEVERRRAALLRLRDVADEDGDDYRFPGPCWCPGWIWTRRFGHKDECKQARAAIGE